MQAWNTIWTCTGHESPLKEKRLKKNKQSTAVFSLWTSSRLPSYSQEICTLSREEPITRALCQEPRYCAWRKVQTQRSIPGCETVEIAYAAVVKLFKSSVLETAFSYMLCCHNGSHPSEGLSFVRSSSVSPKPPPRYHWEERSPFPVAAVEMNSEEAKTWEYLRDELMGKWNKIKLLNTLLKFRRIPHCTSLRTRSWRITRSRIEQQTCFGFEVFLLIPHSLAGSTWNSKVWCPFLETDGGHRQTTSGANVPKKSIYSQHESIVYIIYYILYIIYYILYIIYYI